jgi:hypothetical protein
LHLFEKKVLSARAHEEISFVLKMMGKMSNGWGTFTAFQ